MTPDVRIQRHLTSLGFKTRPLRRVENRSWVIVRRADFPNSAPFVISRKEWEKLPRE